MESLEYTFRNKGTGQYNFDVYDHPSFDLGQYEYSFLLRPGSRFWRFGIALSSNKDFKFVHPSRKHDDSALRFIELRIGIRTEIQWSNANIINLRTRNTDQKVNPHLYDTYIEQSPVEFVINYDSLYASVNTTVFAEGCPEFGSEYILPEFRYFRIFAWAEFTSFELSCTIITKKAKGLASRLIEENKKTKSKSIDISNCDLREIPPEITEMIWLEELIIGNGSYLDYETGQPVTTVNKGEPNDITRLPDGINRLVNLKKLVLKGVATKSQGITDFSPIAGLSKLTDIHLSYTTFENVSLLSSLTKLKHIDLSNTRVNSISTLVNHKSIESLIIANTKVPDITALSNSTKLNILNFDSTPVSDIKVLSNFNELQNLSFSRTAVKELSPLSALSELIYLDCSFNEITRIDALSKLSSLQILYLHNTAVFDLTPLKDLKVLERLFLFNTKIVSLDSLVTFSALQRIDFSNTEVSKIDAISDLPNLKHLNFDKCRVTQLQPILKLTNLESFSGKGNPIVDCPADVYETGDIKQVRTYFQAKEWENVSEELDKDIVVPPTAKFRKNENKNTRKDIKLIILGNTNSGKTNLVNYLETGKFTGERNTTHGLEVHRWLPDENRFPNLKDIAVSIWDFGGQEYYHGAYRLFLSDNALYLLLWCQDSNTNGKIKTRLRDTEEPKDLENFELRYWLDTIRHYSNNNPNGEVQAATNKITKAPSEEKKSKSRLIALQNKCDDPDIDKQRIAQDLHKDYGISESFHVSLLKGTDKNNIRQSKTLENFLSELEFALQSTADKEAIPSKWQLIRNRILSLKTHKESNPFSAFIKNNLWITLSEFQQGCNSFLPTPLTEDELYTIPRWLDKGGTVVYFPDIGKLSDKIFLRPDLLAKTIYQVLNEKVHEAGGEFSAEKIFGEGEVEMRTIFIELAQHLELIFPHPTSKKSNEFLAPQYLPDAHPIEDLFKIASYGAWQTDLWIKVPLFYYKKILHGILIYYAADNDTECRYFWKHGIMFMKNGLRVLIKGLYPQAEENEGVILIGVEKDPKKQGNLQREIFKKCQEIIKQRSRTGSTANPVLTATETNTVFTQMKSIVNPLTGINPEISVSYDGENYILYDTLIENAAEPKVKATNTNTLLITYNFAAILPTPPQKAKKVFLSYSHQNTPWLTRLRAHLSGLRRAKQIETWDDKEILPGDMWDTTIKKRIEEADVFILLLSADFIASEYIWNEELPQAFEKFKNRNATLIPILFEPIDLGGLTDISEVNGNPMYKISDFEIIPKTVQGHLKAVSLWENQEEALASIAKAIREVIQK